MNPELQKALLEIIEQSKGVAEREIPLVLQDLIRAGIIENVVGLAVVAIFIPLVFLLKNFCVKYIDDGDYDMPAFFAGLFAVVLSMLSLIIVPICTYQLLVIWLAPRAYLIGFVK